MNDRNLGELLDDDVPPGELERLRRVHELLLAAGPPAELSETMHDVPEPGLSKVIPFMPRRRVTTAIALAAALAVAAFGIGYAVGNRHEEFKTQGSSVVMRGTALAPAARASLALGKTDDSGNTKLRMRINGLPPASGRLYYELYLTNKGRVSVTCGPFRVGEGTTEVLLSIPYALERYDGWVVTRERVGGGRSHSILLRTRTI